MISSTTSAALNHLLARETWARDKLVKHAGKVAFFDAGVTGVRLKVAADGMVQAATADEPANVRIRIKLSDLPLILQHREHAFSYVQIDGDADFANTISQLADTLRWEAEEDLSRLVGDVAAVRVMGGVRAAVETARSTQQKLAENVAEYFLDEKPLLVRPQTVEDFSAEVARLRDDVERLAKRIEKLKGSR
ncbi:MAG TPA: SCP2 sterol-binding domain-containing protein [Noviherbaspirillum sp.]|uniref:ubiquinone biosynthesis accessory factor UbiJ n=1 Tax=Noviherbaspirillum sp. TaxID=1926288 RepID=UPI002B4A2FDD|nr:SCP2 sterol-binding domain-containing protein [Noviherbaspirillum sp.]HJV87990.1 SCP2 sterol-binding domain-containing protein [Noviherbaspirillum sp.]